jgi:recombination protein RecA
MVDQKAIDAAVEAIEKKYGEGSIMRLGDREVVDVPAISTTSISLDKAIGIGGVPRGRIIEIYGPESSGKTTLALHIVAEAQKTGEAAFIDVEHAMDSEYAAALGVDVDRLLVSQPDSGEQALEIVETLVRTGQVSVIVVDSVAALVPTAELNGSMGDAVMGLQARLMSQACRKLTAIVSQSNTCLIFINQIREKIGVMFGCFNYSSRVTLADGTQEKIGKIVNQRMDVEVLSPNLSTGVIEKKRIKSWFNNGKADKFLQMVVKGGKGGFRKLSPTSNHSIFTNYGEESAENLKIGDDVFVLVNDYRLSADQLQIVLGGALGDGSLRQTSNTSASFRVGHGMEQKTYAKWKHDALSPFSLKFNIKNSKVGFDTVSFPLLSNLRSNFYKDSQRIISDNIVQLIDPRGLAIWYQDDGSFSGSYKIRGNGKAVIYNTSLKGDNRKQALKIFSKLGLGVPRDDGRGFWFNSGQTRMLHRLIAPYVHPNLQYKLAPQFRNKFKWNPETFKTLKDVALPRLGKSDIFDVYSKPKTRSMNRFDLEIEDNHAYFIDGVAVHNSPETTTGGRALKFYASVRLDIRRIGAIKEGEEVKGNRTRVKVVKNKVAPPFKEAEFDIIYGQGISREGDVLDLAVEKGIVKKGGAWFSYEGEKWQGRENAKQALKQNPTILSELLSKLES